MIKKWFGKVGSVLATVLIIVEIIVIAFIVFAKMSGNIPTLFGYQMYVIVSPSMEPDIKVGDIIISKEYNGSELEPGMVVTYLGTKGDFTGKMITHEIVEVDGDKIVTKGKAASTKDPAITRDEVRSVMQRKAVVLSGVYKVVTSTPGFICLVILPLSGMIVAEMVSMVIEIRKEGANRDENEDEVSKE